MSQNLEIGVLEAIHIDGRWMVVVRRPHERVVAVIQPGLALSPDADKWIQESVANLFSRAPDLLGACLEAADLIDLGKYRLAQETLLKAARSANTLPTVNG